MASISRAALFGKLNRIGYCAIESATVFCKMRGNPYVELVHWIHQILQLQDSDLHRIIRQFNLEPSRLAADITDSLDRLPRGSTTISDLSAHVEEAVERAWVFATLMYGEAQVRTGYLMIGIVDTRGLRNVLLSISKEFDKVKPETLKDRFAEITAGSPEEGQRASDGFQMGGGAAPGEASGAMAPAQMGKQEALKQFTTDLTEQARSGKMDPIIGRDEEIRQVVDILMRRRQNNPILVGEAGVGKTAVVEGFAQRIVRGDVPPQLKDVQLRTLDVGLLQAGASMKGEFENRLRQVIDEVQSSPKPIILFIDEAHTLIGAGGAAGTGDAANLLKPALARGTLRTIAATTWAEYKKHIEKDPALTRRFQVVAVEEPAEDKAVIMMRHVAGAMRTHHGVDVLDEAIVAAVTLSKRYIPDRQLPDKAVSLLDTACARVAISQHSVPPSIEDARRTIESLELELSIIGSEEAVGIDVGDRRSVASQSLSETRTRLAELEGRWKTEAGLVERVRGARTELRRQDGSASADGGDGRSRFESLGAIERELSELQGEHPLVLPLVDEQAVAAVVSDWTGIPVGRMVKNEIETV